MGGSESRAASKSNQLSISPVFGKIIIIYQLRQKVEYTLDEHMTVADLKLKLASRFQVPSILQSLVVGDKVLGDHVLVSSLGQAPEPIHMQQSWDAIPGRNAGMAKMLAALQELRGYPTRDSATAAVIILGNGSNFKDVRLEGLLTLSHMQLRLASNERAVPLIQDLVKAGYSLSEVFSCEFTAAHMLQAGYSLIQLHEHGCSACDLRQRGFTAKQMIAAGFRTKELHEAFNASELHTAGYSLAELRKQGLSGGQLQECGFTAKEMLEAGFSSTDLLEAFNASELRTAGHAFAFNELKEAGYAPVIVEVTSVSGDILLGPEPWPLNTTISDLSLAILATHTSLLNKRLALLCDDKLLTDDVALRQLEAESVRLSAVVTSNELKATFGKPNFDIAYDYSAAAITVEPCACAKFASSLELQTTDGRSIFRKLEEQSDFKAALAASPEKAWLLKQLMCSAAKCIFVNSSSSGQSRRTEKHTLHIHVAGHSVCATRERCLSYGLDSQDM
mmetsp:Transcript_147388/g.274698  ORF Transcript_147388/g.274698 Transcript_147388/m.274698 type:complete len:505 (+) Transcript_147388:73-1587(+)